MPIVQPTVQGATEKIKSGAVEFKDAVMTQSGAMFTQCRDNTEEIIRSSPYRSVLIAFGIGALASLLLFRKKS